MLSLLVRSPLNQSENDTLARTRNEYVGVHTPTAYISTGPTDLEGTKANNVNKAH